MRANVLLSASLILALIPFSIIPVIGQPFELSFDDGRSSTGWGDFLPLGAAVRFSPPSSSWKIKTIRFHGVCHLRGLDGHFQVEIWDQDRALIYHASPSFNETFSGHNATLDWYAISVPEVLVTGDFYVAIAPSLTLNGSQLWIDADEDIPAQNRSFVVDLSTRAIVMALDATSATPKDFMIRAIGEPAPAPPELRVVSVEVDPDGTNVTFRLLRANIGEAHARLLRSDGAEIVPTVSVRDSSTFSVVVNDTGLLNAYASTDSGTLGASVSLGGTVRQLCAELLNNNSRLGAQVLSMENRVGLLTDENSMLELKVSQYEGALTYLNARVKELDLNVTEQTAEMDALKGTIKGFEDQSRALLIALAVAAVVSIAAILAWVRKRWKS